MPLSGSGAYYILMNRDEPMLDFTCRRNEFDEPELFEDKWHTDYRPIGYRNLASFLELRKAPKHRRHIQSLLEQFGCDDLEGFIQITHALSLNDTFWVRSPDSTLSWKDVSLYSNEFNELISEAAFDGTISETDLYSTSPEFGTDGYYAKCWVREDTGIYLYKSGSALYEIELISEYLATQLAAAICPPSVPYDLDYYHGKLISKCPLFTSETVGLAKASAVFGGKECTIPEMLQFFAELGSADTFRRMCILDAIILNPDRRYGNFGVLFNTANMELLCMAPVFDNNRGLFPELDIDQLTNPAWYINRCRPRLGRNFLVTAKKLLTDDIRRDLEPLREFTFRQHPVIQTDQTRLDALSGIVRSQIIQILD